MPKSKEPDKPLDSDLTDRPAVDRNPIVDDPANIAELAAKLEDKPAAEERPAVEADTKPDDLREALAAVIKQQAEIQSAVKQMAEVNESYMRTARQPAPQPERQSQQPKSTWREKVAPGTDDILQQAFQEMYEERLDKDIRPSMSFLFGQQNSLVEKELARDYPHPQFGYKALKKDVEAYMTAARQAGESVTREAAYRNVAFDAYNSALLDAESDIQKRSRESKRREFTDTDVSTSRDAGGPEPLDDEQKRAAWMTWPDKSRDEAEKLFQQQTAGAVRDGLLERDEPRARRPRQ